MSATFHNFCDYVVDTYQSAYEGEWLNTYAFIEFVCDVMIPFAEENNIKISPRLEHLLHTLTDDFSDNSNNTRSGSSSQDN